MKIYLFPILFICSLTVNAQELYVFTNPASNVPAKSLNVLGAVKLLKDQQSKSITQRSTVGLSLGVNKKLMIEGLTSFSNMYMTNFRWESAGVYAKYRFFSHDDVHKHFRAALLGRLAYSRNDWMYDEVDFGGDQSGWQLGLVTTQLLHKLAVSATGSFNRVLYFEKDKSLQPPVRNTADFSLSVGYLVLPKQYKSYQQTNLNVYFELLAQKSIDNNRYYVDAAPALQFIFNSTTKLNFGTRFELSGNMHRMASPANSYLISVEHTILNALK